MLRSLASSLTLLVLFSSIGCGPDIGDPATGSNDDLAGLLSQPVSLGIVPSADGSVARVSAVVLHDGAVSDVEVVVTGGRLSLSLDDAGLRVDSLVVDAADLSVGPAAMPPDGATLTGISVALASPVEAAVDSASETEAVGEGGLPVTLSWAVQLEYGTVELAPIRLPALPFELSVELDDAGEIHAHLGANQTGSFWNWAGIFELRDLALELDASTGQVVPDQVD